MYVGWVKCMFVGVCVGGCVCVWVWVCGCVGDVSGVMSLALCPHKASGPPPSGRSVV